MHSNLIEEVKSAVKNWWIHLVLGILFIGVSLMLMFYPFEGYAALTLIFSAGMFACGIFEIIFSVSNRNVLPGWGWYLTGGLIDLLLGIFLICYPEVSALTIPFIMAFWIMFRGFSAIGFSIDLSRLGTNGWGWYLVFGILAVLCAFAIIWNPAVGAFASVYILSFAFLFMGFFRIMLSFELRDLYKNSQKLKEKLNSLQGTLNLK